MHMDNEADKHKTPGESYKALTIDPKETATHKSPEKQLKIMILKKLFEMQENKTTKWNGKTMNEQNWMFNKELLIKLSTHPDPDGLTIRGFQ